MVPAFWAEGHAAQKVQGRFVRLRRFGWSDSSQADAQAHAEQRVQEAMQRLIAGEHLIRREPKKAYNGADGVPIREEIMERHGSTVITRNVYGAQCLNTPHVLFADVDFPLTRSSLALMLLQTVVSVVVALGVRHWAQGAGHAPLVWVVVSLVLVQLMFWGMRIVARRMRSHPATMAEQRAAQFVTANPEWNLRLYRTPVGLRIVATHRLFDPSEPVVATFFDAMQTDPMYAAMCRHQNCFRARLTAKPWRIPMPKNLPLRPNVWPVADARKAQRAAWLAAYDAVASKFAACTYLRSLGSGNIHLDVQPVVQLHDERCRAQQVMPLA